MGSVRRRPACLRSLCSDSCAFRCSQDTFRASAAVWSHEEAALHAAPPLPRAGPCGRVCRQKGTPVRLGELCPRFSRGSPTLLRLCVTSSAWAGSRAASCQRLRTPTPSSLRWSRECWPCCLPAWGAVEPRGVPRACPEPRRTAAPQTWSQSCWGPAHPDHPISHGEGSPGASSGSGCLWAPGRRGRPAGHVRLVPWP